MQFYNTIPTTYVIIYNLVLESKVIVIATQATKRHNFDSEPFDLGSFRVLICLTSRLLFYNFYFINFLLRLKSLFRIRLTVYSPPGGCDAPIN